MITIGRATRKANDSMTNIAHPPSPAQVGAPSTSAEPIADPARFHPLAEVFPLMEGEEFAALVEDIKKHGLRQSITLYEGKILDGRNRYRACLAAGKTPKFTTFKNETDPAAYVISVNIHRRHLTTKQKHELIAKLLKANPERSDRQIGEMAKTSKNTAAAVRRDLERRGQIDHVEKREDTKGRKQPSRKKKKAQRRGEKQHTTTIAKAKPTDDTAAEPVTERMTPLKGTTSWRVQVTDESGKVWSNGVRLAAKDEAMRYMGYALHDFRDNESAIVEIRTVESDDAPNVRARRYEKGPRKGRVGNTIIFPHGSCHNFAWNESAATIAAVTVDPKRSIDSTTANAPAVTKQPEPPATKNVVSPAAEPAEQPADVIEPDCDGELVWSSSDGEVVWSSSES